MGALDCKLYVTTGKCGYSIHLPSTSSEYELELECGVVDAEIPVSRPRLGDDSFRRVPAQPNPAQPSSQHDLLMCPALDSGRG